MTIIFSDYNLLLETFEYNRPLYITIENNLICIKTILIDQAASINLLIAKILGTLALDVHDLDKSKLFLSGFNEQG